MLTEYSKDVTDPDQIIRDAEKERPGQPIKLRFQPMVLRKTGQYQGWKQVAWTLECDNGAEVFSMRNALAVFFQALSRIGPAQVIKVLQGTMSDAA